MSRLGKKRKTRAAVFYICMFVAIALIWMNFKSIWLGIIVFLNFLAERLDAL